jgi:hypothetical protein
MRLWSIHPKYLDTKGLVALWRESLLAQAVLFGRTVGYQNHPQLDRFKAHVSPKKAVASYLFGILEEARKRGHQFDETKIEESNTEVLIPMTEGQLKYEFSFLCEKVKVRTPYQWDCLQGIQEIDVHPLFQPIDGEIEPWEKVK